MEYAALVDVYDRLAATDSRLETVEVLAAAFREADEAHLPLLVSPAGGCSPRGARPTSACRRA